MIYMECKWSLWYGRDNLTDKLIEGANEIKEGKATGKEVEIFGNKVLSYKFPYAMFLCK